MAGATEHPPSRGDPSDPISSKGGILRIDSLAAAARARVFARGLGFALLALAMTLGPVAIAQGEGRLYGVVRDAVDQRPLAGARVTLVEAGWALVTDSTGRYAFDDPAAGPHDLAVRLVGYRARTVHALVPASGPLAIDIALHPEPVRLPRVDVRMPIALPRPVSPDSATTHDRELEAPALRQHPLLAEPDAFQALVGTDVALDPETPSGLHVHGGAADQTGYLLDGIPMHQPYHAAGITSAWNPDVLSLLRLWSTRPAPDGTDHLSGTVEGSLRAFGPSARAQVALSTTQARLAVDGPLGGAGAGYGLALRSGIHDLFTPKSEDSYLTSVIGDGLARVDVPLGAQRLGLLFAAHDNDVDATAEAAAGGPPGNHEFKWGAQTLGLSLRRAVGAGELRLAVWDARSHGSAVWVLPDTATEVSARRHDTAARLAWVDGATRAALRVERLDTEYRVDGGAVADLAAAPVIPSLSAEHARRVGAATEIGLGASLAALDQHVYPAGQARVSMHAGADGVVSLRYARTRQFTQSLRNPESVVGAVFPASLDLAADASTVPVASGDFVGVDAAGRLGPALRFEVSAWLRDADDLVLVAPRGGAPFATRGFVEGRMDGAGASAGFTLRTARWGGLLDYAYEQVRLHYADSTYVPQHSARHRVSAGVVYFASASTMLRLGAATLFGRRSTTSVGPIEWESCNFLDRGCEFVGSPELADVPRGGTALPDYVRLDLGVRKHWHVALGGRDASITAFLTLTNLLDRANVLTYTRRSAGAAAEPVEMRPLAPLVFGVEGRY